MDSKQMTDNGTTITAADWHTVADDVAAGRVVVTWNGKPVEKITNDGDGRYTMWYGMSNCAVWDGDIFQVTPAPTASGSAVDGALAVWQQLGKIERNLLRKLALGETVTARFRDMEKQGLVAHAASYFGGEHGFDNYRTVITDYGRQVLAAGTATPPAEAGQPARAEVQSNTPEHEEIYAEYQKWLPKGHEISYVEWLEINLSVERDNHTFMIDEYKKVLAHERESLANARNEIDIRGRFLHKVVDIRTELVDTRSNSWLDSIDVIHDTIKRLTTTLKQIADSSTIEVPEGYPYDTGNSDDKFDHGYKMGLHELADVARKALVATPQATAAGEGYRVGKVTVEARVGMTVRTPLGEGIITAVEGDIVTVGDMQFNCDEVAVTDVGSTA